MIKKFSIYFLCLIICNSFYASEAIKQNKNVTLITVSIVAPLIVLHAYSRKNIEIKKRENWIEWNNKQINLTDTFEDDFQKINDHKTFFTKYQKYMWYFKPIIKSNKKKLKENISQISQNHDSENDKTTLLQETYTLISKDKTLNNLNVKKNITEKESACYDKEIEKIKNNNYFYLYPIYIYLKSFLSVISEITF